MSALPGCIRAASSAAATVRALSADCARLVTEGDDWQEEAVRLRATIPTLPDPSQPAAPPRTRPTCATCNAWEPPQPFAERGECRADTPRHGPIETPASYWCRRWAPLPAGQPRADEVVMVERKRCLCLVEAEKARWSQTDGVCAAMDRITRRIATPDAGRT